jgi:hypothetical protein
MSRRLSHRARTALGLVTMAAVAVAGPAAAEELVPGATYAAGTRVQSASAGLSFVVPRGWVGKFGQDAGNQVLVLGSHTIEGVGLAIVQAGRGAAEMLADLEGPQDLGAGVVLQPTGRPVTAGARTTARYEHATYVGRALALSGPSSNGVVFFFAGPRQHERLYMQLLDELAASTTFGPPRPAPVARPGELEQAWTELLAGHMLRYFSSYGSGGGGGGMSSSRVLHLCRDGRFAYAGNSLVTMNVPGGSASSGGRDGARGRWQLESATRDTVVLVLVEDGGQQTRWHVRYDGSKTLVNGRRWFRVASDACR